MKAKKAKARKPHAKAAKHVKRARRATSKHAAPKQPSLFADKYVAPQVNGNDLAPWTAEEKNTSPLLVHFTATEKKNIERLAEYELRSSGAIVRRAVRAYVDGCRAKGGAS